MNERGSASILGAGIVGVVVWLGVAMVAAAGGMVAKAQTQAAADAAALAAASPAGHCGSASRVAGMNGARLSECRLLGSTARVMVERVIQVPVFGQLTVRASASAELDVRDQRNSDSGRDSQGSSAPRRRSDSKASPNAVRHRSRTSSIRSRSFDGRFMCVFSASI